MSDVLPDASRSGRLPRRGRRWAPAVAVLVAAGLVALTSAIGRALTDAGVDLHLLGGYVLRGPWQVVLTPQVLLPVTVAVAGVLWGPGLAVRVGWRPLLAGSTVASALWAVSLALSSGWGRLTEPLASRYEYPYDVGRVGSFGELLATFNASVPSDSADPWTTHVSGHPPGALLAFVLLDRVGLGGLGWAAALCILGGAVVAPAVLVTVRSVVDEGAARVVAPFAVLTSTALWVATSADALFAGVFAGGVALLASSAARPPGGDASVRALGGGLLTGLALFLSFGVTSLGLLVLAVVVVHRQHLGWAGVARVLGLGALGVLAVAAAFTLGGYWWFDGLAVAADRVQSGPSYEDRPLAFFLMANLAAAAIAAGPAAIAGLGSLRRSPLAGVLLAVVAAVLVSNGTGLVRGETERIWLPFTVWLVAAVAFLPGRHLRWWLVTSSLFAVLVEVTVRTEW